MTLALEVSQLNEDICLTLGPFVLYKSFAEVIQDTVVQMLNLVTHLQHCMFVNKCFSFIFCSAPVARREHSPTLCRDYK